jgi:Peptidase propeptide and YPEB domain
MKMRTSPIAFVLVVATLATAGLPVWAQGSGRPVVHEGRTSGMSMDQAVRMAEQRFKARVVRAESQQSGNHTIYVLRMLNESGRVWTVRVDASSGAVL